MPEPVLGETCNFLRNHVRNGPALELQFLDAVAKGGAPPLGYVDASVIAMAERSGIADIATIDYKFLGMASQVSTAKRLHWVVQEGWQ